MDYARIYGEFIADRRSKPPPTCYSERHHIVPRSLGGDDNPENLIRLTAEDHIFAHLLLAKAYGGALWFPLTIMLRPARQLGVTSRGKRAIRIAAIAKREQSKRQSGARRPDVSVALSGVAKSAEHRANLSESRKGWRDTEETRAKKSAAVRLRVYTPERNARVSAGLKGRTCSDDHRHRISAGAKVRHIGSGNPRYDSTVRTFIHEDGRIERLPKHDMARKHGLNRACLNYVISGVRRTTGGWRLFDGGADQEAIEG